MAIEVRHKFVSQKADGSDESLIRPSNWNDTHEITVGGKMLVGRAADTQGAAQEISVGGGVQIASSELSLTPTGAVRADISQSLSNAQKTQARNNIGIWHGTQSQYDAISSKDANTLYFIT